MRLSEFARRGISIGTAAAVLAISGLSGAAQPKAGADSKAWTELTTTDERELAILLDRLEGDAGAFREEGLLGSIEQLRDGFAKREERRLAKVEEATSELRDHLEEAEQREADREARERDVALSEALRVAVELQLLADDEREFNRRNEIRELIATGEGAAREAELRGDWLLANELYYRLSVLLEQEGAYRGDVKRLGSRLSMIRLYAPERFWEMRDERRRLEGLDPLPPYNPTGDRYDEKLEDVNERMLLVALQRAANQHLDHDRQTMGELLQSGLAALETFVTTPDLADTFPGLNDARKRREFLDGVAELSNTIADDEGVGFSDALRAVRRAIALNRATIGVDVEAIVHEFGNGSMSALDDYSAIIWPDEIRRFERSTRGEFVGVGIQIQLDELQNIKVVTPLEGTPAQKAGVRAEDRIVGVNGVSTVGFTLDQAVEVITGPRNTDVTLTIERGEGDDTERFDLNVDRRVINLPTVKGWRKTGPDDLDWDWFIDPDAGVGYVRITSFAENTTDAFDAAIRDMKRSESGLNALILDLRFNPGGLLDQAVSISNRFVPPDRLVVKTVDSDERIRQALLADRVPRSLGLQGVKTAVLVNNGSASASEIVSGAIQAYARAGEIDAIVIGQRSFGKGSVQNVFGLDNAGAAAMKLTTSYYKLFGDRTIHRVPGAMEWGIQPDVEVELLPQQVIEAAEIRRDADLWLLDGTKLAEEGRERPDPEELLESGADLQLNAALLALQRAVLENAEIQISRLYGKR